MLLLIVVLLYGLMVGVNVLAGILAVLALLLGAWTTGTILALMWLLTAGLLIYLDTPEG
jgi:hypothetical protein